jgi:hypothetical protein
VSWEAVASFLPFRVAGIVLTVMVTIIGVRMLFYWWSFFVRTGRYRARRSVSTAQLRAAALLPYIKVQWTTKGSPGSSEVILRGIRQLEHLVAEDPAFYSGFVSAEVFTENPEQAQLIADTFYTSPLSVDAVATPPDYVTPNRTALKAWQLHYAVELRRGGWNKKPGKTFIVHFDEDTLMVPDEFRKLISYLSATDKAVTSGPIYYPLEYTHATRLARATEASRPITCFECTRVMSEGVPLHIHGSNLVVEEEFENFIGWDIGQLDGQAFVAEDYMFGMLAFMADGRDAFGWHGCVALEQPPFSFPSVYRQRFRWVFGVLQGMSADKNLPAFRSLPRWLRLKVIWGTRYRIFTYASGAAVGALSLLYMAAWLYVAQARVRAGDGLGVPAWLSAWFAVVGLMWLGSNLIGATLNIMDAGLSPARQVAEVTRAIVITPVAGLMENLAALRAVWKWVTHQRSAGWTPTPSTISADAAIRSGTGTLLPLAETVREAPVPWEEPRVRGSVRAAALTTLAATLITCVYVGIPMTGLVEDEITGTRGILVPVIISAFLIVSVLCVMFSVLSRTADPLPELPALPARTPLVLPAHTVQIPAIEPGDDDTDIMAPQGYYQ